jgi:hypothetical protein
MNNKKYDYYNRSDWDDGSYTIHEWNDDGSSKYVDYYFDGTIEQITTSDSLGNYEIRDGNNILVKDHIINSDGGYTENYYDSSNTAYRTVQGDNLGNYSSYDINGKLTEKKTVLSENEYNVIHYFDDNSTSTGNYVDNQIVSRETCKYDNNNRLYEKEFYEIGTDTFIVTKYNEGNAFFGSPPSTYVETKIHSMLVSNQVYENDVLTREKLYEYYDNGNIKDLLDVEYIKGGMVSKVHYDYDENGDYKLTSDYYLKDKLVLHLEDKQDAFGVVYNSDGTYSFYSNGDSAYLNISEDGTRTYYVGLYYEDHNRLILKPDGTFTLVSYESNDLLSKGKYTQNKNGSFECVDEMNNVYQYNSFGQLTKKIENGITTNYDYNLFSEKVTKNNKSTYYRINHIEYDEEEYENIMKGMVSLHDDYSSIIKNNCNSCESIINSFPDKYNGNIDGINTNIQSVLENINTVKESINYSLLAYSACDKEMEEATHLLIDDLFDDNEKRLANVFKKNIQNFVSENDNILKYKKDTNFEYVFNNLIPIKQIVDANGNEYYYNLDDKLISVNGDNPKVIYGGKCFNITVTDEGIIKLTDENGKPLDIYGEYNLLSKQYGGSQMDLLNVDLENYTPLYNITKEFFPNASQEELGNYYTKICETGCGYTALVNCVFKEFEGREEEFYKTFGYPMYEVNFGSYDGKFIDYNYEPIIAELYSFFNQKGNSLANTTANGDGTYKSAIYSMFNYLDDKYDVFKDDYNTTMTRSGMFSDDGYTLYNLDGTVYLVNGGCHMMTKLGEIDDTHWIVSTWGEKMICEVANPQFKTMTEEEINRFNMGLDVY